MLKKDLEKLTVAQLKEHCKNLGIKLKTGDTKSVLIDLVYKKIKKVRFDENSPKKYTPKKTTIKKTPKEKVKVEKEKKEEKKEKKYDDKSTKVIGYEGKDAIVYEIKDNEGKLYAMKKYKKNVKAEDIKKEAYFLEKLNNSGITPKIYFVNLKDKYIVMEKFEKTLYDEINEKGKLSQKIQKDILAIHKKLDKLGVFHGDPSPLNLMFDDGKLKIIDFGFSRDIDDNLKKEVDSNEPNYEFSTLGLVLKIKDKLGKENISTLIKPLEKKYSNIL